MNKKIITLILIFVGILIWYKFSTPLPATEETGTDLWKTSAVIDGLTFEYPEMLPTDYIHSTEWPPKISLIDKPLNCTESGKEIALGGQTSKVAISGREYCITKESEGAAGSIYTNYNYAFSYADKTAVLTFTLRAVQCDNYDEPNKSNCKKERANFDINSLVDQIAYTVRKI